MKHEYQKPEIEIIKINGENILAASLNWSPDGGNNSPGVMEESGSDLDNEDIG